MHPVSLHDDVIDAALTCASTLLGMEVVYFGRIDHEQDTYRFERVIGESAGVSEGAVVDFATTYCRQMVDGAHRTTCDVASDPVYGAVPPLPGTEVVSYVGVPVIGADGEVIGTLCGFDSRRVEIGEHVVGVLTELAGVISARHTTTPTSDTVQIRRTPAGWAVGDITHDASLTSAMVLADLLADDLDPTRRPERPATDLDETARLRASISQLEHALAARVTVEQAIGVVAERRGLSPREAFEALRKIARRGGIRVHVLAGDVVRSVTDPTVPLTSELSRP